MLIQTSHGRAQRRVLAIAWCWFFALAAALRIAGVTEGSYALELSIGGVVVAAFALSALRRDRVGLSVSDGAAQARLWCGSKSIRAVDDLEIVVQDSYHYAKVATRRVPYLCHVPKGAFLRRLYPGDNQMLVRSPSGRWERCGVSWADDTRDLESLLRQTLDAAATNSRTA